MLDLIKIVNKGDTPLVLRHDGKGHVTIDPGKFRILTVDYAHIHFGDPRAVDAGKDKARTTEFEHARTTWGFYPGLMPEAAWEGRAVNNEGETVGPYKPQVECYDLEDNRVFMVIDDPDGSMQAQLTGIPTMDQSDQVERNAMAQQLAAQQKQINDLSALVLMQQQGVPGGDPLTAQVEHNVPADERPAFTREQLLAMLDDLDEDEDDEPELGPNPGKAAKATKATKASKAAAAAAQTASQADRNEKRDEIPNPPADEPPVTSDSPKTTRIGGSK
jgi:hypothetical protein